jgi:hypothetical protein
LFDLVDKGQAKGLEFNPLRADLFRPEATALIDEVKLSNLASQRVLARPLLSKEGAGKTRGHLPGRPASGGGIHLGAVGIVCRQRSLSCWSPSFTARLVSEGFSVAWLSGAWDFAGTWWC